MRVLSIELSTIGPHERDKVFGRVGLLNYQILVCRIVDLNLGLDSLLSVHIGVVNGLEAQNVWCHIN